MAAAPPSSSSSSPSSLLLDALLRLPGSTARRLPGVTDAAAAALAERIAALLGPGPHAGTTTANPHSPSLDLTIDGQAVVLRLPTTDPNAPTPIPHLLAPLCLWLRGLVAAAPPSQRVIVGVVGAAGAGKSYLCALLAAVLCRLADVDLDTGGVRAVTVSMDAYHLPNAELEARGVKHLKGNPETLDPAALLADLRRLRVIERGDVALPIYDRQRHDPVPGGLVVSPAHRLVLVEGLHLLHGEEDPAWAPLLPQHDHEAGGAAGGVMDAALFLDVPKAICRERVVARKVRNGRAPSDAEAHFRRVDEPIFDRLRAHDRERADLVLHFSSSHSSIPTAISLHRRLLAPVLSGPMDVAAAEARRRALAAAAGTAEEEEKPRILTLGLNPCVQKVLKFEGPLLVGDVNRAASVTAGVGGKGQNFAKAARLFGSCGLAIAQWLGGASGLEVERQLRSWGEPGMDLITQPVEGATRTCCSLLHRKPAKPAAAVDDDDDWAADEDEGDDSDHDDNGDGRPTPLAAPAPIAALSLSSSPMTTAARRRLAAARRRPLTPFVLTTEIVEPGAPISAAEQEGLIDALCAYIMQRRQEQGQEGEGEGGRRRRRRGKGVAALAVMGSLPTGLCPGYYARVVGRVWPLLAPHASSSPLLFLDTVIGLDALLALRLPIAMLKVNAAEARGFVCPLPASSFPSSRPKGSKAAAATSQHDEDKEEEEEEEDRRFCAAVRGWLARHPHVRWLAVTSGPLRARLFRLLPMVASEGEGAAGEGAAGGKQQRRLAVYTYHIPFVPPHEIVNPIGAGDTCSAVTLSALLTPLYPYPPDGEEEEEGEGVAAVHAFRLGLAAATASCLKEENSTYDLAALWSVAAATRVEARVE